MRATGFTQMTLMTLFCGHFLNFDRAYDLRGLHLNRATGVCFDKAALGEAART
jgi:hypothetical protein